MSGYLLCSSSTDTHTPIWEPDIQTLGHINVLNFCCSWLQLYQQYLDTILVQYALVQFFFPPQTLLCHLRFETFPHQQFCKKKVMIILKQQPPIPLSIVFARELSSKKIYLNMNLFSALFLKSYSRISSLSRSLIMYIGWFLVVIAKNSKSLYVNSVCIAFDKDY